MRTNRPSYKIVVLRFDADNFVGRVFRRKCSAFRYHTRDRGAGSGAMHFPVPQFDPDFVQSQHGADIRYRWKIYNLGRNPGSARANARFLSIRGTGLSIKMLALFPLLRYIPLFTVFFIRAKPFMMRNDFYGIFFGICFTFYGTHYPILGG